VMSPDLDAVTPVPPMPEITVAEVFSASRVRSEG
jgi:hypothetical protein